MTQKTIKANDTFSHIIETRLSDKFSRTVYVKFKKDYGESRVHDSSEMFLTPSQLAELGRHLIDESLRVQAELDK